MGKEVVNWFFITIFIIITLSSWLIYTAQSARNKEIEIYNRSQCNTLVTTPTPKCTPNPKCKPKPKCTPNPKCKPKPSVKKC